MLRLLTEPDTNTRWKKAEKDLHIHVVEDVHKHSIHIAPHRDPNRNFSARREKMLPEAARVFFGGEVNSGLSCC